MSSALFAGVSRRGFEAGIDGLSALLAQMRYTPDWCNIPAKRVSDVLDGDLADDDRSCPGWLEVNGDIRFEATKGVARPPPDVLSLTLIFCAVRRRFRRRRMRHNPITVRKASPPITPPTMAPVGFPASHQYVLSCPVAAGLP